jgi:nucleolar protein 14
MHQMERQKQKEETTEETTQLDKDWTAVHGILIHQLKPVAGTVKKDDYDKAVKSLIFDAKAKPTDRLKTDEELAK